MIINFLILILINAWFFSIWQKFDKIILFIVLQIIANKSCCWFFYLVSNKISEFLAVYKQNTIFFCKNQ